MPEEPSKSEPRKYEPLKVLEMLIVHSAWQSSTHPLWNIVRETLAAHGRNDSWVWGEEEDDDYSRSLRREAMGNNGQKETQVTVGPDDDNLRASAVIRIDIGPEYQSALLRFGDAAPDGFDAAFRIRLNGRNFWIPLVRVKD